MLQKPMGDMKDLFPSTFELRLKLRRRGNQIDLLGICLPFLETVKDKTKIKEVIAITFIVDCSKQSLLQTIMHQSNTHTMMAKNAELNSSLLMVYHHNFFKFRPPQIVHYLQLSKTEFQYIIANEPTYLCRQDTVAFSRCPQRVFQM